MSVLTALHIKICILDTITARDYTTQNNSTHRLLFSVTLLSSGFQQCSVLGLRAQRSCPRWLALFTCSSRAEHIPMFTIAREMRMQWRMGKFEKY
jgi:hypothetical protein